MNFTGVLMEELIKKSIDLCVPVYLDQQTVFDLLAMLEDGFSNINTVNTSTTDATSDNLKLSGSLSNVVSLVKVAFSGNKEKVTSKEDKIETWKEKTHTPSSMFSILRLKLQNKEFVHTVKNIEDITNINCGDIIEFRSNLAINPFIDTLIRIKEVITFAKKFEETNNSPKFKTHGKNKNEFDEITEQINILLEDAMESNSSEFIGKISEVSQIKVDISVKNSCFTDNDISLITNGEFYVFGKVIKIIQPNSNESVNLLRKFSLRSLNRNVLDSFVEFLNKLKQETDIDIPEIITSIKSPVIQVLPIAIFI